MDVALKYDVILEALDISIKKPIIKTIVLNAVVNYQYIKNRNAVKNIGRIIKRNNMVKMLKLRNIMML